MPKYQKTKKNLTLLMLFSLLLLIITPLAGFALTQPSNTSLLSFPISVTQTPENITVGQTWTYRLTYHNDTHNESLTFTQKITGIENIIDWNSSAQECYVFQTKIDILGLGPVFFGDLSTSKGSAKGIETVREYINTTNFSNPRTDTELKLKDSSGYTHIRGRSYLRNATFDFYKFPLSDGLSWETVMNESVTRWEWATGFDNSTYDPYYQLAGVNVSVSGPVNVTVPLGTYETYQITYTNDTVCELFCEKLFWVTEIEQVQGWYSLEAGNFVKYSMEVEAGGIFLPVTHGNVTIELVPSPPTNMMLPLVFYFSAQQQQGSSNVLLTVGLILAVAVIGSIGIVIFLARRGG